MARIISSGLPSFLTADRTNLRLGINSTSPTETLDVRGTVAGGNMTRTQNNSSTGYSGQTFYDSGGSFKFGIGYGNSGVPAPWTSTGFVSLSTNLIFSDGTTTFLGIDTTKAIGILTAAVAGTALGLVQPVATSGNPIAFKLTTGAHTTLPDNDVVDFNIIGERTVQFNNNTARDILRCVRFGGPTYSSNTATKAITEATILHLSTLPSASTNATITRASHLFVNSTFNPSAGATKMTCLNIQPTINETGTASGGYSLLYANVTETAVLGAARLLDLQVGGADKFVVTSAGTCTIKGALDHDGTTAGFFNTTPATQRTSGANLTNNVTSGGTDDTITNWTDLTTYATDAAAIRNAVYQLSRKLKQINDGLRTYGLFT